MQGLLIQQGLLSLMLMAEESNKSEFKASEPRRVLRKA